MSRTAATLRISDVSGREILQTHLVVFYPQEGDPATRSVPRSPYLLFGNQTVHNFFGVISVLEGNERPVSNLTLGSLALYATC